LHFIIGGNKHYRFWFTLDTPPSSLMDSIASPKLKTTKGEGVGVRSLVRNTSRVEGVLELWDGTKKIDKQINYSHELAQTKQQVG
jgi:hypothetical protein